MTLIFTNEKASEIYFTVPSATNIPLAGQKVRHLTPSSPEPIVRNFIVLSARLDYAEPAPNQSTESSITLICEPIV